MGHKPAPRNKTHRASGTRSTPKPVKGYQVGGRKLTEDQVLTRVEHDIEKGIGPDADPTLASAALQVQADDPAAWDKVTAQVRADTGKAPEEFPSGNKALEEVVAETAPGTVKAPPGLGIGGLIDDEDM